MLRSFKKLINYYAYNRRPPIADRTEGIGQVGHRGFVGGDFVAGGERQFRFCKEMGLKPSDVFLDVACGSLRLGRLLIPYLEEGNYVGIDREESLIQAGLKHEIDAAAVAAKKPQFLISGDFDFSGMRKRPNFCVAFSLFTHLDAHDIRKCLRNMAPHVAPGAVFYATFSDSPIPVPQFFRSHSHRLFCFTHGQMRRFGAPEWDGKFVDDRGVGQKMFEYRRRPY
jgi:SAM-dependent methyltransferase